MPNYGLHPNQRERGPWGLPRSVLVPGKVITDPVHGDVFLTKLEVAVIDSRPFQRLRRVRQLGNTHLVYPGAVHTRFSHCLGALKMAQMLLDVVWDQSGELHGVKDDLFSEWREKNGGPDIDRWAEASVVARLGALLHDLCHVPAGHTVEDDLLILEPHDENESRFLGMWAQLRGEVPSRLRQLDEDIEDRDCETMDAALFESSGALYKELVPLIISKGKHVVPLKDRTYPFCADLVGNTICADLLDYLDRDHLFAGLPESLGRRFISAFFVTPEDRGPFGKRLTLNIFRGGHERTDIVSELLKALRYRYELSERALVHPAKLSADAMLGESIERWEWTLWWSVAKRHKSREIQALEARLDFDPEQIPAYREDLEIKAGRAGMSKEAWRGSPFGRIRAEVRGSMEEALSGLGDDALLDFLVSLPDGRRGGWMKERLEESAVLAEGLRDRKLFRMAGRVGVGDVSAKHIHGEYGNPTRRAALELEAQRFADVKGGPAVVLWIPPPDMRLKLAEVLVQHETGIAPFVRYERSRSRRGSDIYDAHERLWAAYVFVRRDVGRVEEKVMVSYLARSMGVRWERHLELGGLPSEWPLRLAISEELEVDLRSGVDEKFEELKPELLQVAARFPEHGTFKALKQEVKRVERGELAQPTDRRQVTIACSLPVRWSARP
jgi:HD superfamily phosphohydrolase